MVIRNSSGAKLVRFHEETKQTVTSKLLLLFHKTTAGRSLVLERSVKGKGTRTISPLFKDTILVLHQQGSKDRVLRLKNQKSSQPEPFV